MNKKNIIEIIIIIVLVIVLGIIIGLFINEKNSNTKNLGMPRSFQMDENKQKETSADDVDAGQTVNSKEINLSEYDSNLTISEAGTYTLSGSFKNSVVINATGDVTLILNGVNIESTMTAAIANGTTNPLIIKLADNTINNL